MPSLSLKIVQDEGAVTKKVKLDSHMTVKEAHKVVKDKVNVANKGQEYALFLRSADDEMTGVWLEDDRTLDYYLLRDGDSLDYICRMRNLRVRLLDDTVKTLQVDEAKTVGELMMDICARIGIKNYDEYGLCKEEVEETEDGKEVKEPSGGGFTLRRPKPAKDRDVILEQMSKRLKTDDNVDWLDQHRTIREQGIDFKETLLLKRRLFYSDRNVDSRDPVQLHLLYVQTRDAILKGRHPVTEQQAVNFAGLQCHIQLGDYDEKKHKPGFIEKIEEYLPAQYLNAWSVEKKIMKEFATHQGKSELEAKFLYIKTARAMPTYGVTFFLVKEKQKDKKKLVPRLLGINAEAILRLDEVTKEILQQWPLTHVKTYHAGKSQTFTLNFGDYSDKEYSVKTQDCHRIRDILEGYIDIIRRRMMAKPSMDPGESMAICHDNVQQGKSHLIQHVANNASKIVTESFVGPTKLVPYDQGSHAQSGAMITTVQQIVVTDHLQNQQQALKGEMPLRGDMSKDCIRKLNRLNSNSVKIVGLLTNPTETHIKDAQQIVWTMKEDFPVVEQGVKETADKQTIDDAKKMLLDELQDLDNFLNKLTGSLEPGKINPNDAKDAAESIADLTTQMYFSIDPKTQGRSALLRRSRKSFRDGEKTEQTIRRASFIAAATTALHSVDTAAQALHEDYTGPKLSEEEQKKLEKALEDRLGKLNAAIALYLMAHSDPDNIDYAAAINSMNAINELMPKLARDAQILASTKDPAARKQLQDEMRTLFDATKKVCGMTGNQDHEKMQEASNQYADVAGKLLYKFSHGNNADKENEIVQLAKDVGAKVSRLLVTTNELTCQAKGLPASSEVDEAGVRTAGAARDLLHSAQLTAPAIHEPHCQSALTAAAANLASAVHQLESTWRPVVEDPTRQHMADLLHTRANDVAKALDKLRDAYGNLEGDEDDAMLPQKEKRRLKFITTLSGAKNRLQGVKFDEWNKLPPSNGDAPSEQEQATAQRRLEQKMAQLNAAVAALAAATADRNNPDYDTAELALSTITELMPKIAKDMEIASNDKDEATRNALRTNLCAMCDAAQEICVGDGYQQAHGEPLANFAAASSKLVFLVSPGADKGKQKHILDLSATAHQQASELVSQAHRVQAQTPPGAAGELGERADQTHDDAQALRSVAQVTAASIAEDRCRDALSSAVSKLQGSADKLNSSCQAQQTPQLTQQCAAVKNAHSKLSDSLGKLADVCDMDAVDNSPAQQEKQRLQFVQSMSGAKRRLDAAAQQLTKPMACHVMTEEHAAVLEQQLSDRLAQLNAAVAALAAATADREHPNYIAAEQAVKDITSLMPHVVQDSRKLCGTKNAEGQAAILQDIRALCDASKEICDSAGQPQGLADAAARFTAASRNLMFFASPGGDNDKENEVIGLSADACGKASQLLSQVQHLTQLVPDAGAAAELDSRGARAADAAQALLTIAQATAPTIANSNCQKELISAAEKLRSTTSDLTSSCQPHLEQKPEMKQQVLGSQKQLADSLDKLIEFCKSAGGTQSTISPAEKEKRRLKFINSLTGARNRLYDSEQQLKQPLTRQSLIPEDAAALEHRLSDRLAQLNAAVAALAAAKADPANPDYVAAEKAVKEISELMPLIVQDSRKLSSIKEPAAQAAMLEDLKALCQASRNICENTENSPKVNTTDFNKAASKLVYLVSPAADKKKEKQVMDLSEAACKQASDYLSAVQSTSEQLGPVVAAQVRPAGARVQDAADNLHAVALATSPSISEPICSAAVVSAAENLRSTASDLTATCGPHIQQAPEMKQQVLSSQRKLADSLDKLVSACQPGLSGNLVDVPSAQQQEKQRLKFISSVSGAKDRLDAAEKQLKEPMICQMMRQEDGAAIEQKLSNRLAQLNAALAALAAATADRERPDYAAADHAIRTISELIPQVVKESHTLCGTKTGEEQAAMLQDLRALCEASREICDSAGQPQGLSDAAAKFSAASGKLVYIVSPKAQDAHEKQVMALSAASCGKASELLTQVQRLTALVPHAAQAAELDSRGARAADAAQALLTVAQATAPTIGDPHCQKELISAAENLRSTASHLTSSCAPHLTNKPEMKQQVSSSQKQLDDSLDKLLQACKTAQQAQQEKHRVKFISSVSGVKNHFHAAEQQLKEPLLTQTIQADPATLQHRLAGRLAQLNAAIAALAAATADREQPDYAAAHHAVETIPKVLREIIHDSRALSATKDDADAAVMTEDLRALCDASRHICENAGQPQGLGDAAAKYSAASAKMMVVAGPETHSAHGKQVIDLAAASSGKAGELLSQVKRVTALVPHAAQAAELDSRGARAADAAQALLTVAQITASSISEPDCDEQVISAADKLRSTASDLTSSRAPHLTHKPEMKQQVSSSQKQLDDSLDKLVQACKTAQQENTPSAQQEKHRLKFISSVSGVKSHFDAAEQQLKEPLLTQTKQADPAEIQHRLADRLAQLNAAVAALAAATADREHPDFVTAHRAVESIPKILREVIHDSRALSATKDGPGAAAMTEDLVALCEASREICLNTVQPQGLGDAAAKFSAASGKMIVAAGPNKHSAQEKQVIDLTAASCGKASELLSRVQRLTELVPDSAAAAELDYRGARAADAAQGLLNVVQITASSISEPGCADQLISAAEKLHTTAGELTSSCAPHLTDKPEMTQQVLGSQKQLADSLDKLIQACKAARQGTEVVLSPQQEKQRIKFVSSVSGAKKHLDTAEQQMKKPVVIQNLKQADSATLQHQLSRRLAQLNAAVAALAAATQDGKNPDYPAAERAVTTVIELMPQVVQDSHTLSGTKDTAEQAAMLKHLRELCDASRAICESAGQPKKLNAASAKLANASGKLVYIVSPEGAQGSKPAAPVRRAPPPTPARDPKHTIAQAVRSSVHTDSTQDFLDTLRGEESQGKAKIVAVDAKKAQAIEDDKRAYKQYCEMIDSAEKGLKTAEDSLKVLHNTKTTSGKPLPAVEVARREQHMEDSLARAGVQVAALVAANYADKLDYKAAMEPTISLTEAVKSVVNDGSAIYSSLPEQTRKPFVEDMAGLCQATKSICDAAKSKEEVKKLNDAAISFGDQSVKLLRVVSCNIDPALEKQVISRAKAIGDTASRLALEAGSVASNAKSSAEGQTYVQDICTAGASCVDAAGKLAYTAKLIAPTIHHATCQDTLISSADNLSTSLTKFSKTWAPLASSQQPTVHKLTQEAAQLEDLVEKMRKDVRSGKLGKRKEMEQIVNLDSPLRKMTVQIIETAKSISEYGEMPAEQKKEYVNYSARLEEAIRALDLANARSQRAPQDRNKRDELDIATQDLQVTLLQTRPSRAGQEQNNIVDFRDFLQDLVKEAWELKSTAKKNEGPAGKRTTDDIKLLSSKISEDASKLLNPSDNFGDGVTVMNSVDDIMDIDMFGQECDVIVKEINSAIQGIHDQKAKQALRAKALPLTESCHLLRFAVNSHIMATKSLAYDDALESLDNFKTSVMHPLAREAVRSSQKEKKSYSAGLGSDACGRRASASLLRARTCAVLGEPQALGAAVTYLAAAAVHRPRLLQCHTLTEMVEAPQVAVKHEYLENLGRIMDMTGRVTMECQRSESKQCPAVDIVYSADTQAQSVLKELNDLDYMISSRKIKTPVLNAEDIDKLLMCKRQPVEGTTKQLEEKLHQLSTKLSSMSGTVILSVKKPESLARSLHAAADVAEQLANTARALKDSKRPVQCKRIEEAAHEMCLATYSLLKTSELVCQDPNHHDARRKLQDACRHLNDSINKLVRSVKPSGRVNQECGEVHRSLQLQRSLLQASPQPCGALPYVHCVDTLQSQRDVLHKLNSDQAMSREEFLKSLNYVASAVSNSTECAAQAIYLISVSEKDESIGKEGTVDVAKLHKSVGAIEETCVSIIMANHEEKVKEETAILKVQVQDLQQGLDDGIKKTKEGELAEMLKACRNEINKSSKSLFSSVQGNPNDKDEIISKVMDLMDDVNDASSLIEHPDLVPTAGEVSAETQKHIDEVVKSSLALLSNTEELIKQVKAAPEEPEVMKWVMFNKRKDVLEAFENLLKNVKTSGQRVKLIEGSTDDSEEEKKSYVQKQFDSASKWLTKSVSKAEVKTNGQQAVRNLIEVANKVTVDLKGSDKEDMKNLVTETEQLLTECSKKYDHEQYSVLMERVRELKKGIERGVVTRVVEDFIDAEAPLADLDLVDYEKDESKRKFLLEKKIAELLAQLSRVTKTARLIADTDKDAGTTVSTQLNSCSEQAELLAPMLVKAAQQRVASPDDKAVIENYKALLTRYAESLSKIRDLCDQSVDPMEFVQTAGETMERMREESTKHNDPMKCAHTSAAITKLANRVIHVSMSSSTARSDPELQRALTEAQAQLTAATPAADTRASRMPDWKDHTAKILQATGQVESLLGGENVFMNQPGPDQPIYNEALNLHVAIRDWSSRDNEIVAVAKRMAVLMAKLSNFMTNDKQREVLATSKSIVTESHEVTRLAKKLAHECTDHRIKTNLLQTCERIPTISGQLKMLTTVKGFSLGRHGTQEDKEALDMLVGNAQSLMMSIQDVVKGAASASVKIMSQRGPRMKWVRKTVY